MDRRFLILILSLIIFLIYFAAFNISFARVQTSASTDSQELIKQLQELIKSLQVQIDELHSKLEIAKQDISIIKSEIQFNKFLSRGISGDEVKQLQEFLKQDTDIYPEGIISGYFGPATETAVKRFQKKHGIQALGIIGPKTRAKLNELLQEGSGVSNIIPPGLLVAPGIQKRIEISATTTQPTATTTTSAFATTTANAVATTTITIATSTTLNASSSTQTQTATTTQIQVQATSTLPETISATPITSTTAITSTTVLSNSDITAQTATTTVSATSSTAATTTATTTDTIPPIISLVSASNITQTEATIVWNTDEASDSLTQYGISQSYGQISQNGSLTIVHTLNIAGLSANTTYHYQVKSKDASGNEAASNDYTFTTLASTSDTAPGTLKWTFTTFSGEYNLGYFAVAQDGTIYFGNRKLTALNPDGTQKWIFNFDEDNVIFPRPPAVIGSDGIIYASTGKMLYAINPDGVKVWKFNPNASIAAVSISPDNTIYISGGGYNNTLYALNFDGSLKWTFKTDSPSREIQSAPAIAADGTIYIGTSDYNFDYMSSNKYKLYAVNPNGTKKWEFMNSYNALINSFAIGGDGTIYGGVYVGGGITGRLFAINPNGALKWTFATAMGNVYSPTIGSDGTIYATTDFKLYAVNPDGTQKWIFEKQISGRSYQLKSPPTIGNDSVLYMSATNYSQTDKLFAISPDGALSWEFLTGGSMFTIPTIATDGTVYVWANDGKIYAIRSNSTGLADSSWPKPFKNNRNTSYAGDPLVLSPAKSNLAAVLFSLSHILDKLQALFKK